MLSRITRLFPLWALLFALIAYFYPQLFVSLKGQIVYLLMIIMLTMGLTLTAKDFVKVLDHKGAILIGLLLQFIIMPISALMISRLLGLDKELTIGMILVGSVAGGTSSNVMCYLAKANVALSITMTALSTFLGIIITPLWTSILVGQNVDVQVMPMFISLIKIVFVPVVIGICINQFFHKHTRKIESFLPLVSMIAIVTVIAIVVALNANRIAQVGTIVAIAIVLHNAIGLMSGYWIPRFFGFSKDVCRTISFEVGLQNSGLATALAFKFFTPASALPGALFSVWHNISGSVLAGFWSRKEKS